MNLSPIVLFVYNRPWHTRQTILALQKNELAKNSELFIYSDNAKNDDSLEQVTEVRNYIKEIDGFKKTTIIKRDVNLGLDPSIIDGVTKIINEYGKIIVLEDDIVTSPYFLKFMNDALNLYQNEQKIYHISGWNYPIETNGLDDVFFWRLMNCWGWATWSDRWKYYENNIDETVKNFTKEDIKKFNLIDGTFWKQVTGNLKNKRTSWDIRWYSSIFKRQGFCLNPSQTFVNNIGLDNSGVHCGETPEFSNFTLNKKSNIDFNINLAENTLAIKRVNDFYTMFKNQFLLEQLINYLE